MSNTVSLVILVVILAIAAVLAVIVYIKVQRGEWLSSFRLDKSKDLTHEPTEKTGSKSRFKPF